MYNSLDAVDAIAFRYKKPAKAVRAQFDFVLLRSFTVSRILCLRINFIQAFY